jgi:hypothetical protein
LTVVRPLVRDRSGDVDGSRTSGFRRTSDSGESHALLWVQVICADDWHRQNNLNERLLFCTDRIGIEREENG